MPSAARVGDRHRCLANHPVPHRGGPILGPGCRTVLLGGHLAARVGDLAWCDGGEPDVITSGCASVEIGGCAAARAGDTTHGGYILSGYFTVTIGARRAKRSAKEGRPHG